MRLLYRPIALALVAPMLALAVTASGFVGLRCRITGMVSIATCCPSGDSDTVPERSSLDDPGCCEHFVVDNLKPPAAGAEVARDAGSAAPPLALLSFESLLNLPGSPRAQLRPDPPDPSPDPSWPPLHLLHRSLLI
jgi:hypothetical protein